MQVQHEAHLIDAQPKAAKQDSTEQAVGSILNKSLDRYTLANQINVFNSSLISPIDRLTCCSNGRNFLAVHSGGTNQIIIYDTRTYTKRLGFPLKSCDKRFSRQSFQVSGLEFSPDGQRLAIGQTDCIIYIYKLPNLISNSNASTVGNSSGTSASNVALATSVSAIGNAASSDHPASSSGKPTISGKFATTSPVTCLLWSELGIVFGTQDGKVKIITMPANASHLSARAASGNTGGVSASSTGATGLVSTQDQGTSPKSSSQAPPKVITVFSPIKTGVMPISLAFRSPVLLIGLTDHTVKVLFISSPAHSSSAHEHYNVASQLLADQPTNANLAPATSQDSATSPASRKNSSSANPVLLNQQAQPMAIISVQSIEHSCPPSQLNILLENTICCSGSDGRLALHTFQSQTTSRSSFGQQQQQVLGLSWLQNIDLKEDIIAADYSSVNEVLALVVRNRLLFVKLDQESHRWRLQNSSIELSPILGSSSSSGGPNYHPHSWSSTVFSFTSLAWVPDGSQLVAGCSNGRLELFRCFWNKQSISDQLDICHIAKNRVRITDRERNLLATYKTQSDIKRVNLLDNGQSVIIWTSTGFLLARLPILAGHPLTSPWGHVGSYQQSEIPWNQRDKRVKFHFESSGFVLVFSETFRELQVIKLGENEPCYTTTLSADSLIRRNLISLRRFPPIWSLNPSGVSGAHSASRINSAVQSRAASAMIGHQHRPASMTTDNGDQHLGGEPDSLLINGHQEQQNLLSPTRVHKQTHFEAEASRYETIAFVVANQQQKEQNLSKQLTVIDLKTSNKRQEIIRQHEWPIVWLELSFTSRYLIFRNSIGCLYLVRLIHKQELTDAHNDISDPAGQNTDDGFAMDKEEILLKRCHFAGWIPETDSLIAQSDSRILIWYDLNEMKRCQTYDSRSFNINQAPPVIDLSLQAISSDTPTIVSAEIEQALERIGRPNFPVIHQIKQDKIELSNRQQISLDRFKAKFYSHLIGNRFELAFDLLDRQLANQPANGPRQADLIHLFNKLAWLSLDRANCSLAMKIFEKLNYKNLSNYIRNKCLPSRAVDEQGYLDTYDDPQQLASQISSSVNVMVQEEDCECHLATLRGDWDKFERVASNSERVVQTYKRLNRWSRCLAYLSRKQQFRQRDLVEQEHKQWLISRGRHYEAAKIQAQSSGDLAGALELLMGAKLFVEAARLFLDEQGQKQLLGPASSTRMQSGPVATTSTTISQFEQRLLDLANTLLDALMERREFVVGAKLSEKLLANPLKALDLYLEAREYQLALGLINQYGQTNGSLDEDDHMRHQKAQLAKRRSEIEILRAEQLIEKYKSAQIGRKTASRALEHLLAAQQPLRAMELAHQVLHMHERAYRIMIDYRQLADESNETSDVFKSECRQLAESLLRDAQDAKSASDESWKQLEDWALEALELGEAHERLVELLIGRQELERAYRVSLERLNSNSASATSEQFLKLGQKMASEVQEHFRAELESQTERQDRCLKLAQQAERVFLLIERPELAIELYRSVEQFDKMLELIGQHQPDQLEGSLLQLARHLEATQRFGEAEKYLLRASPNEWTNVVRMYRLASRWSDAYRVARDNCISDHDPLLVQLAYWWARSLVVGESAVGTMATGVDGDQVQLPAGIDEACRLLTSLNAFKPVIEFCCETKNYQFALDLAKYKLYSEGSKGDNETDNYDRLRRQIVCRYAAHLEQQQKFERAERLFIENHLIDLAVRMYIDNDKHQEAIRVLEQQQQNLDQTGDDPAKEAQRNRLTELLNASLIECANKLAGSASASSDLARRDSKYWPADPVTAGQPSAGQQVDQLVEAQRMYLRAQRPDLAIEMYKSRCMWQEATHVAQRFAPQLLEEVERALDEQLGNELEPILRQVRPRHSPSAAEAADGTSTGAQPSLVGGQRQEQRQQWDEINGTGAAKLRQPYEVLRQQIRKLNSLASAGEPRVQEQIRALVSKFMAALVQLQHQQDHESDNELASQRALAELDSLLQLLTGGAGRDELATHVDAKCELLRRLGLASRENLDRVWSLAAWVLQSTGNLGAWATWRQLRDSLAWCLGAALGGPMAAPSDGPRPALEPLGSIPRVRTEPSDRAAVLSRLERGLLAAHLLALHCGLVSSLNSLAGGAGPGSGPSDSRASNRRQRSRNRLRNSGQRDQSLNGRSDRIDMIGGGYADDDATDGGQRWVLPTIEQLEGKSLGSGGQSGGRREELLGLLSKVSLALLRYADLMEPSRLLYAAGLWQLGVVGGRQLARRLWSLLVEIAESRAAPNAATNNNASHLAPKSPGQPNELAVIEWRHGRDLLKFVDVADLGPVSAAARWPSTGQPQPSHLAQVKQWLLSSLIIGSGAGETNNAQDQAFRPGFAKLGPGCGVCLASGLPAQPTASGTLVLGDGGCGLGRQMLVLEAEWDRLRRLARPGNAGGAKDGAGLADHDDRQRPADQADLAGSRPLANVVEFLIQLSGGVG